MSKFFLFFCILFYTSCQWESDSRSVLSSNIHVVVAPYGPEDKIKPSKPFILTSGGHKVCRPSPFRFRDAKNILKDAGLEQNALDLLFNIEEEGTEEVGPTRPGAVRVQVGENWLKFGLWIANRNKGKNNFFLVIENIIFKATAVYRGEPLRPHSGNVDAGYCDSGSGGGEIAPFLYLIPPNSKSAYSSISNNPLENLTIYIDGFPIIDRSNELSFTQQQRLQRLAEGGQGLTEGSQGRNQIYGSDEIRVIPDYTVELTLIGYFMTKSGIQMAPFSKRVKFNTSQPF